MNKPVLPPVTLPMAKDETKWKRLRTTLAAGKTSIDRASFYMLRLYRTNLEVRLRCIDQASLQSDSQKQIYADRVEIAGVADPIQDVHTGSRMG